MHIIEAFENIHEHFVAIFSVKVLFEEKTLVIISI
jgi:hypothetical protein